MKTLRNLRRPALPALTAVLAALAIAVSPAAGEPGGGGGLVVHDQVTVDDSAGDGDRVIEPGEPFSLSERIRNVSPGSINGVSGYMYSMSGLLSIAYSLRPYPDIPSGGTGTNTTPFSGTVSSSAPCGTSFLPVLYITSAQGTDSVAVPLRVGVAGASTTRSSTNVPLPIPSPGMVESELNVSEAGLVADVTVQIGELRHTYLGDLRISLISPDGTLVVLAQYLDGVDLLGTVLDDSAERSLWEGQAPYTGTFRPAERLGLFGGRQQQGTWKLRIEDEYSWDSGTLYSWGSGTSLAYCNRSPVAEIAISTEEPRAKEPVTFESISSDTDGSIASEEWDLDNDGAFDDARGVKVSRTFPVRGSYVVGLRVVDDKGDSAVVTEEVPVGRARTLRSAACVVPNVKGKTLRQARRMLKKRHCRVGRVTSARSRGRAGRIVSQRPKPGTRLRRGGRVNLTLRRR